MLPTIVVLAILGTVEPDTKAVGVLACDSEEATTQFLNEIEAYFYTLPAQRANKAPPQSQFCRFYSLYHPTGKKVGRWEGQHAKADIYAIKVNASETRFTWRFHPMTNPFAGIAQ